MAASQLAGELHLESVQVSGPNGGAAIDVVNSTFGGTLVLENVHVVAASALALRANGVQTVTIDAASSSALTTLQSAAGAVLDLAGSGPGQEVALDVRVASLDSGAGYALSASYFTGRLHIDALSATSTTSAVLLQNAGGTPDVRLSAVGIDSSGPGVILANVPGGSVTFDGLTVDAGGVALSAQNVDGLSITGSTNALTGGGAQVLSLQNVALAATGASFESVTTGASNSCEVGILLAEVIGGPLRVTGSGSVGSGGSLHGCASAGVQVADARDVRLSYLTLPSAVTGIDYDATQSASYVLDLLHVTASGSSAPAYDVACGQAGNTPTVHARVRNADVYVPDAEAVRFVAADGCELYLLVSDSSILGGATVAPVVLQSSSDARLDATLVDSAIDTDTVGEGASLSVEDTAALCTSLSGMGYTGAISQLALSAPAGTTFGSPQAVSAEGQMGASGLSALGSDWGIAVTGTLGTTVAAAACSLPVVDTDTSFATLGNTWTNIDFMAAASPVSDATTALGGSVSVNGDGTLRYTPPVGGERCDRRLRGVSRRRRDGRPNRPHRGVGVLGGLRCICGRRRYARQPVRDAFRGHGGQQWRRGRGRAR